MYQNVAGVAQKTGIPEDLIQTYITRGWLSAVSKGGATFLASHQEGRLKFVHHLCTKMGLGEEQVIMVLRFENPPYSLADVPAILAQHCR